MAKIAITCRTLQEEWCPARHQDEAASAAVLAKCLPVCKNGEQREILENVQVENAVEASRVEKTRSDIASLTRQSAQSDHSQTRV